MLQYLQSYFIYHLEGVHRNKSLFEVFTHNLRAQEKTFKLNTPSEIGQISRRAEKKLHLIHRSLQFWPSTKFYIPFHWLNFLWCGDLYNKASSHFLQNLMNEINVCSYISIKQPVTDQELYQMTKGAESSTLEVHHEQTFYLSNTNECSVTIFQFFVQHYHMQFSYISS